MARITNAVETFTNVNTNQGRNCTPYDSCTWIGTPITGSFDVTTATSVRDDVTKVPIVDGWRAPTNYAAVFTKHKPVTGSVSRTALIGRGDNANGGTYLAIDGYLFNCIAPIGIATPSQSEFKPLTASSLSKLMDSKVNLAMMLATRKQSVETLASLAARLAQAARAAGRRDFSEALNHLGGYSKRSQGSMAASGRGLSDDYMAYTFGVSQMMSDIYGIYQECTDKARPDIVVVRSSRRSSASTTRQYTYRPWYEAATFTFNVNESFRKDLKQVLWYELDSTAVHAAARLGLANPAYLVYDAIKWSYVLDWLVPVGQYLQNLTAELGFSFKGGCNISFIEQQVNMTFAKATKDSPASYKNVTVSGSGSGHSSRTDFKRTVVPDPGAASGVYIKNPFSTFTVTTSLAILGQKTLRK